MNILKPFLAASVVIGVAAFAPAAFAGDNCGVAEELCPQGPNLIGQTTTSYHLAGDKKPVGNVRDVYSKRAWPSDVAGERPGPIVKVYAANPNPEPQPKGAPQVGAPD